MRLGRLVAAGLVAGAVAGFVGALLRPRTVQDYRPDTDRPATDARGDLAEAGVPASRAGSPEAVSHPQSRRGSAGYALATSAGDDASEGSSAAQGGTPSDASPDDEGDTPAPSQRTLDVDAVPAPAVPAVAASRGANG